MIADRPVRSPNGGIAVLTTEQGLPMRLKLAPGELKRPPQDLAAEILALCQLSAKRAQVKHRRELAERGFSAAVIRTLNLATDEELAQAEADFGGTDDEDAPIGISRPV
jgi:hypothetical protein